MKIKVTKLIKFLFWISILSNLHFLRLFKFNSFFEFILKDRFLPSVLAIIATLIALRYRSLNKVMLENKVLRHINIYTVILYVILLVHAFINYPDQKVSTTLLSSSSILFILWGNLFVVIYKDASGIKDFFRDLNKIIFIWLIVVLVQSVYYGLYETTILGFYSAEDGSVFMRNGRMRIQLYHLTTIAIIYNFDCLFSKKMKNRLIPFVVLILGIYLTIFVEQTRMKMICLALGIAASILFSGESKNKKIINISIVFASILILFLSGFYSQIVDSFSVTGEYSGSTTVRLSEIVYYLNIFKNKPLLGLGALSDSSEYTYSALMHGSLGRYYLDDIGYIGQLANGGVLFFALLIYIWKYMLKTVIKAKKYMYKYSYFVSMVVYMLIVGLTIPLILTQRADMAFPVLIGITALIEKDVMTNEEIKHNYSSI